MTKSSEVNQRDFIAIHAMTALISLPGYRGDMKPEDFIGTAQDAYRYADAMIEVSNQKKEQQ